MENETIKPGETAKELNKEGLSDLDKTFREITTQFQRLLQTSLEKLKEYGVSRGILDPNIPLEEVRPKLLERIEELTGWKKQVRVESAETPKEE